MSEEKLWKGNEALRPYLVDMSVLRLDEKNARYHPPRSITAIAASLEEFGQQTPVTIDKSKEIKKGNATVTAARKLNWTHIAAVVTDMDPEKANIYAIADNRVAELSMWDKTMLSNDLRSAYGSASELIKNLWEDYELQPLINEKVWQPPSPVTDDDLFSEVKMGKHIRLTGEERLNINKAVAELRAREQDAGIKEGRCVELICADWLS